MTLSAGCRSRCPMEVIPLLMDAFRNAPDAPGPFVWIYPFDEYSGTRTPDLVLNEDLFIGECVQSGFPLNTVISTGNFTALTASGKSTLDGAVLVVPVSAAEGTLLEGASTAPGPRRGCSVLRLVERGGSGTLFPAGTDPDGRDLGRMPHGCFRPGERRVPPGGPLGTSVPSSAV